MAARSKKSKLPAPEPSPPEAEQQLAQTNEQREKAAQCELELVRLFLVHDKHDIARRRLQNILAQFSQTRAAAEADQLLHGL